MPFDRLFYHTYFHNTRLDFIIFLYFALFDILLQPGTYQANVSGNIPDEKSHHHILQIEKSLQSIKQALQGFPFSL